MNISQTIENRLRSAFSPEQLEVINESHLHANHSSSPGTGESHFHVKIVAKAFEGKSRIECHRMINEILAEELAGPVHALAIKASAE